MLHSSPIIAVPAADGTARMPAWRALKAAGVEVVLAGMREAATDDDGLLRAATGVFAGRQVGFERERAE